MPKPKDVQPWVRAAVEGLADEAALQRLLVEHGVLVQTIYGKQGKDALRRQAEGYNRAARWGSFVLLLDLNHEAECAPSLRKSWIPHPAAELCFLIAVREVEAWFLADRDHLSKFLGVSVTRLPREPDSVDDPKRFMVDLAARSRWRTIREDMTPRTGSGRVIGPAYTSRLIEFAQQYWQPAIAAKRSPSLERCRRRIAELSGRTR